MILLTNAIARSGAERYESIRMATDALLREKSFGFEGFWFSVNGWVVVHSIDE